MGGGEGQALVQKWGQVLDGGIDKIFARWGDPYSPRKKPCGIWKEIVVTHALLF